MHVELVAEPTFTVKANGREVRGMRVVSKWEGLRKLEDAQGRVLIVADVDGPLTSAMREAMSPIFGGEGRRCVVVMGSVDLVGELATAKPAEAGHADT